MQEKYKQLYVVLLVFIVFIGFDNSVLFSQVRSQQYTDIPNGFLSFDITKLTKKELVKILISKKKKYESPNNVEIGEMILTNYFIGNKFDKSKVKRVIYYFTYMGGSQNDIEIEFDKKYYEQCHSLLMSELGKPSKKKGADYLAWEVAPKSSSSVQLISLSKSSSLYFYKGLGLEKDDDAFYLLLRSKDMRTPC